MWKYNQVLENGGVATQGASGSGLGSDAGEVGQDRMQLEKGGDGSSAY